MRISGVAKAICVASLAMACVMGLAACSSNKTGYTGGTAATVNGVEIKEDTITAAIEGIRSQMDLSDADAWGEWMATYGYTPETVRSEVLDSYIQQELIVQYAGERGVEVSDETIQSYVDSMKSNYENDEAWKNALSSAGITEDEYRQNIKISLLSSGLQETFTSTDDPDAETMLTYCKMYVSYFDGAKRSSHILFAAGDEATAQSVLDQINAGTLDFAEAAKQYSQDSGSAAKGGDVGWDMLNSFVTEYTTALTSLEKGQVSALVTSSYGIHIIKCTDVYSAPEELTSVDQVPEDFQTYVKSLIQSNTASTAYSEWLSQKREEATIDIKDMPKGVAYYVDMTKYESSDSSNTSNTSTSTESSNTANTSNSSSTENKSN